MSQFIEYCIVRMMPETNRHNNNAGGDYARFVGLGFTFVFVIGLFLAAGYGLDFLFGTLPLFLLLGMVAGLGAALYYLFVRLKNVGGG